MTPSPSSHPLSRRQMLGKSTLFGAGALLGNFNILRGAANDQLIKIGLVGCGGRGTGAADQTLSVPGSNVKLWAVADAFEDKIQPTLSNLSNKHTDKVEVPVERQFAGPDAYAKLLEQVDMVVLATPPGFRPFHFEAAVKAGKNIFMEKPVCVDSFGANKVLEVAKEADAKGLKVVVGLQRHYDATYREAYKKVIEEGMLGDILSAQVYWNGGAIWYRDRKPNLNEMQFQVYNWYHFQWLCGDHICEQHVHNLDVANWFLGGPPIEAAVGIGGRQVRNPLHPTEIFDHHYVEYRYPNGVVVNSQCRQITGTKGNVSEEIRGSKAILRAPGEIVDYKGNILWRAARGKEKTNPYQVEHNELHAAIRNNTPLNNAYYGATSSMTAVLGRYATYSGQSVTWDDAMKKNHRTMPENFTWESKPPHMPDDKGQYELPMPGTWKIS
jgi:myo-inositol 2-dehydrogenase/D-chiro-inositol 1-dehydrogenase